MDASQPSGKSVEVLESEVIRLRNAVDQLSSLNELARLISTAQDLEALNQRLVRHSLRMIGAEQGVVTMVSESFSPTSTLVRTRVMKENKDEYRPNDAVLGWMGHHKKPLRIDDVREAKEFAPTDWHPAIRSVLCAPLLVKTRLIGVVCLFNKNAGATFSEDDERLLFIIAMQSSQVIENQRLLLTRNQELEEQVAEKTAVLRRKNLELEKTLDDLRRTQEKLIQQEKLASLGQLTAGIAHEIKNPLNFITNFAQLNDELLEELKENPEARVGELMDLIEDLQVNASRIDEHGRRADGIVKSMMQHASGATGVKQLVNLNAMVKEYITLAHHGWTSRDTIYRVPTDANRVPTDANRVPTDANRVPGNPTGAEPPSVTKPPAIVEQYDPAVGEVAVVPQEISQVLVNLCNNAFDAMLEKSKTQESFDPQLTVGTAMNGEFVEIRIADNGKGIPLKVRDRVFDPFFTTKPAGAGTGLGLSLSHDIVVKGHGGEMTIESEEGKGTTFIIRLPAKG